MCGYPTHTPPLPPLPLSHTKQAFSTPLRAYTSGFDQQIAEMIGEHMKEEGTKFLRPVVPTKIEKADDGRLVVTFKSRTDGAESQDVFDTVVAAIGTSANTHTRSLSTPIA